ncbi:hypothetical protein MWU75_09090 [Ornithinimicrobium sp. F0845]|uniref:hypothetical protein n=1 Tax=Ornithinimicrobium sp. F0845 TaxID=2926412 RepID=UPI001FF4F7A0|nr:hypothetical protein [Ornithinimicrobium sp. F0845]MCK0112291.1 hypothetical protein [Ornithinimicrobium sp. F0845]
MTGRSEIATLLLALIDGGPAEGARARLLAALEPAVEAAPDDTLFIPQLLTPVARLEHHRSMLTRQAHPPGPAELAGLADAVGLLSEDDVDAILAALPPIAHGGLLRQRIHRLVTAGHLEEAHAVADSLKDPLRGHRDIGLHLARAGDVEGFFATWPRLEPRRATAELVELREELVAAVARTGGWRAAVELVDTHPRLGDRYLFSALGAGPIAQYDVLLGLLDGDLSGRLTEVQQAQLLVDELLREVEPSSHRVALPPEDSRVLALAERLGAIDGDRATIRVRDWQFVRLWPLIAEEATLKRVRALVRAPNLRRELSALGREIRPPG